MGDRQLRSARRGVENSENVQDQDNFNQSLNSENDSCLIRGRGSRGGHCMHGSGSISVRGAGRGVGRGRGRGIVATTISAASVNSNSSVTSLTSNSFLTNLVQKLNSNEDLTRLFALGKKNEFPKVYLFCLQHFNEF